MEAEFLKQLKAVDDAAPTAATSDFWPTQFHGINTIAFKASPIATGSPANFFLDEVSMMVGQARPPNNKLVVSLLGSHPISKTFFPCCAIM
jgi:hypothetical protein